MKESVLYPTIRTALLECGCAVDKIPGATYSQGLPDFIATYRGLAAHLEAKIKNPKKSAFPVTELQAAHLIRHSKAGAVCGVLEYQSEPKKWTLYNVDETWPMSTKYDVLGHRNLGKMLMHYLEYHRRGLLGLL